MSPDRPERRTANQAALALFLVGLLFAPGLAMAQLPELEEEALPDLIAGSTRLSPPNPHEAQKTKLCADVRNMGESDVVNPFDVAFLIDGIDEGGVRVQETIRPGGAVAVCREFQIPAGRHQFTVDADVSGGARGEVIESNENNNRAPLRHFEVTSEPRPDLTFTRYGVYPRTSTDGSPQAFSVTVWNRGRLDSTNTTLDIIDDNGRVAPPWPVPAIKAGQTADVTVITRPDMRRPGNFTVQYILDPSGLVQEEREDNNYAEMTYTISEHPLPNLVVSNATLNGTLIERRTLRLDVRVENAGDRAMGAGGLATLIATNETGHNRTLGNQTFPQLKSNEGASFAFFFNLVQGNHTLTLQVDPHDSIIEHDEADNVWRMNVTVTAPEHVLLLPNLVVHGLDAAPDDPRPNEVVTMTALVGNVGDLVANNTVVAFLVDGTEVGRAKVSQIKPDAQMTISTIWGPTEARAYTIRAVFDPDNKTEEYIENDNAFERPFTVRGTNGLPGPADEAPQEPAAPPPTTPPPTTPTPPTGGNKTPDSGKPPTDAETPPRAEKKGAEIADFRLASSIKEDRLVGSATVTLRNPNLDILTGLTLKFSVDGQTLKEVLVPPLQSAATRGFTSGDLNLPPGKHTLSVEVRRVGVATADATTSLTYDEKGPSSNVPGPELLAIVAAGLVGAALTRRRYQK